MVLTVSSVLERTLKGLETDTQIYVAYSGGLDSQVLLHTLAVYSKSNPCQLTALHVNYGLSEDANRWQDFCERQCKTLDIPILVKIAVFEAGKGNLERRARDIRYRWFESLMMQDAVLFTAHHQNDQAETVILRLLRASGVRGLAAIPPVRPLAKGRLIRPLLEFSKAELKVYAQQYNLQWVEDKSNKDLSFDRNYIRHQVLPKLGERWPQAVKQLARSASNCRDEQSLLNELAAMDVALMQANNTLSLLDILAPITLDKFKELSSVRQRNVMQHLLGQMVDYPISQSKLSEWLTQLEAHTKENKSQLQLDALSLAVYAGQIHFLRPIPAMANEEITWQLEKPLQIPALSCTLSAQRGVDNGSGAHDAIIDKRTTARVHWRQGGERVQLKGETFTRSLKKLLQERRVAPWLRNALPLVSIENQIIWSAALGDLSSGSIDSTSNCLKFTLEKNKPDSVRI